MDELQHLMARVQGGWAWVVPFLRSKPPLLERDIKRTFQQCVRGPGPGSNQRMEARGGPREETPRVERGPVSIFLRGWELSAASSAGPALLGDRWPPPMLQIGIEYDPAQGVDGFVPEPWLPEYPRRRATRGGRHGYRHVWKLEDSMRCPQMGYALRADLARIPPSFPCPLEGWEQAEEKGGGKGERAAKGQGRGKGARGI